MISLTRAIQYVALQTEVEAAHDMASNRLPTNSDDRLRVALKCLTDLSADYTGQTLDGNVVAEWLYMRGFSTQESRRYQWQAHHDKIIHLDVDFNVVCGQFDPA